MASRLVIFVVLLNLASCGKNTMTEEWCDQMLEKPNKEWTEEDFKHFSADCLLNKASD